MADTKISEMGELAVPDAADFLPVVDASLVVPDPSNANKWILWSSIKSALKTYFDTLYSLTGHTHAALHNQQHAITGTADHTSTATSGQMLKANASGLPVDASNTDTEVASAVSLKHTRSHALDGTSDHTIGGLTSGYLVKSDGAKVAPATNTDTEVASAVSLKHTQGTDTALGTLGTKNPPIDADKAIYRDSTASDGLVTSTWTQVKAFLKAYFDTLYGGIGSAHARQHAITATADHTSTATSGRMLKADANGLPVDATNTDSAVAAAVTASHAAVTLDTDAAVLLDLTAQEIGLDTQTANTFLAGPATGAANEPTFRAITADDVAGLMGGGNPMFVVDGALAVAANVGAYVVADTATINAVYIYCSNTGTASSTIVDVNKNGTSIFAATPANRPELVFSTTPTIDKSGTPDTTALAENDVLTVDIDAVATGAAGLTVIVDISSGGGGGGGAVTYQAVFTAEGTLVVGSGAIRIYNKLGATKIISQVFIAANDAPTGQAIIVDIRRNGTTVFTNPVHRPQIVAGAFTGTTTTIDAASFADGDYLTMEIDQIGSGVAGSDLSVHVIYS